MQYNYTIKPLAVRKVRSFYKNVYHKYPNTYSYYDMLRYINNTVDSIYYHSRCMSCSKYVRIKIINPQDLT